MDNDGHAITSFCYHVLENSGDPLTHQPVHLARDFDRYFKIYRTLSLPETVELVQSIGVIIKAVDYLPAGAANMMAKGVWHIHYSSHDWPSSQKFSIFHELFEIVDKTFTMINDEHVPLNKPQLCRNADRFAGAALLPPEFFARHIRDTGYDVVELAERLELSHQCLLIGFAEHLNDMPMVGAIYESFPRGPVRGPFFTITDFIASIVVRTYPARFVRQLCPKLTVPTRNSRPTRGSLVCTAITAARPVLWRNVEDEGYPVILIRPVRWFDTEPQRLILLALPDHQYPMLLKQLEITPPIEMGIDDLCPNIGVYPQCYDCYEK